MGEFDRQLSLYVSIERLQAEVLASFPRSIAFAYSPLLPHFSCRGLVSFSLAGSAGFPLAFLEISPKSTAHFLLRCQAPAFSACSLFIYLLIGLFVLLYIFYFQCFDISSFFILMLGCLSCSTRGFPFITFRFS